MLLGNSTEIILAKRKMSFLIILVTGLKTLLFILFLPGEKEERIPVWKKLPFNWCQKNSSLIQ